MRGAVSLAAALALPLTTDSGSPFPGRDTILFRYLRAGPLHPRGPGIDLAGTDPRAAVREDGEEERKEEPHGRLAIAQASLGRIEELSEAEWTNDETIERVRALY